MNELSPELEKPSKVHLDLNVTESSSSTHEEIAVPQEDGSMIAVRNEESCGEEASRWQELQVRLTCLGATINTLLKVNIFVEGTLMLALIDTGATKSMVDQSSLDRAGIAYSKSDGLRIYGVAEAEGISAAGRASLSTCIDGVEMKDFNFTVLPVNVLPIPVIIGADYLQAHGMRIDTGRRRLLWSSGDCDVELYIHEDGQIQDRVVRRLQFFAAQNVIIEKGTTAEVPVYWNSNISAGSSPSPLFFDGSLARKLNGKVKGLPGLLNFEKETPVILLSNSCDQKLTIPCNKPLGIFTSVVELEDETGARDSWTFEQLQQVVNLDHLSDSQKKEFLQMLWKNVGALSSSTDDIGRLNSTPHHIELHDATPIYQRPRRFAAPIAEEIEHQCRGLQNLGIIEESASPWSSPVVPIRKKDGSLRLCVDYRALNRVTKADKFPIPNIADSVFGLHGVKYFTKLDITKGFYQVPLDEQSKEYTAFTTPHGHWQFNVLSFGLKNAPAAFQRGMRDLLIEFPWKKVIVYVDDILIMGSTFEEHLTLVSQVLSTLLQHGVKIKLDKCEWAAGRVEFLGHVVSSSGVSKTEEFVKKVANFPQPETVQQLREFLGLVNFQRKFLQHCSEVQQPLSALTGGSKNKKLDWTNKMIEAFEELKRLMKEDIELAFPDYSDGAEKLELWVDASQMGAGACLTQVQDGDLRIIAFASVTFDAAQRNYSILDKELTAMRWGVKTFRAFLYGVEFVLRTDHQPLVYLHNMRLVDSRLARTLEDLADFNFVIRYTPGRLNVAADTLSRLKPLLDAGDKAQDEPSDSLPTGLMCDGGPVPGGGNSLFEALLKTLKRVVQSGLPKNHIELRQILVDELLMHSERYYIEINRDIRRQLRLMRNVNQLPCIEVLLAASYKYHIRVLVYFWGDEPVVFTALPKNVSLSDTATVHLQCQAGIHFNPLVEMNAYRDNTVSPCCSVHTLQEEDVAEACGEVRLEEDSVEVSQLYTATVFKPECTHRVSQQPMISLKIGSVECCAILDTGAEASLISAAVLKKNRWKPQEEPQPRIELVGITGKRGTVTGFVTLQFNFSESSMSKPHKFAVVDESAIPCCVLLGLDFMAVNGILLDLNCNQCTTSGHGDAYVNFLDPSEDSDGFVGYVAINVSVEQMVVGSPASNLRFQLEWDCEELQSLGAMFGDGVVKRLQQNEQQLRTLKRVLSRSTIVSKWPLSLRDFRRAASRLRIDNDTILYVKDNLAVPVIPFTLMVELVLVLHHNIAHIGRDKVLSLLSRQVWHPNVHKIVGDVCRTCPSCQLRKIAPLKVWAPTQKISTQRPFELVAADLVEFGKTSAGYIGCLMVVDHNSKWLCAVPIKDKKAVTVGKAFEMQVLPALLRIPERILTDNGPEFASAFFNELLDRYGIQHVYSTPYHPASNGAVERINRTIISFISGLATQSPSWDLSLPRAVSYYNTTLHSELGDSPADYLLKQQHIIDALPALPSNLKQVWNDGHERFSPFAVGDRVIRKVPLSGRLTATKFDDKYEGPYTVIKVHTNEVAYELRGVDGNGRVIRAHYTQLRQWNDPPAYIRDHEYYRQRLAADERQLIDAPMEECGPVVGRLTRSVAPPIFGSSGSSSSSSESESTYSDSTSSTETVDESLSPRALKALNRSLLWPKYDVPEIEPESVDSSPAAEKDSSGTGFGNTVEDWDMSFSSNEALVNTADIEDDLPALNQLIVGNVVETVFEAGDRTIQHMSTFVNECCSIVSTSFSGFEAELQQQVATFATPLIAKLDALRNVLRDEMQPRINTMNDVSTRGKSMPDLSDINNKQCNPYQTRSRGPVEDLPNVQATLLERKKKRD